MKKINILDVTLRDGMHAWSHKLSAEKMAELAMQIDTIGAEAMEFGHGNGLGASSIQYGIAASSDCEYLELVSKNIKNTKKTIVIIPGIGTRHELNLAKENNIEVVRIATQMSECDIGAQHIRMAREMGFEVRTLLPLAAALDIESTVKYAKMSESFGSQVVYLLDGGGSMLPEEVFDRVTAMRKTLDCEIGFHGHNNMSLAVANSLAAVEGGATHIDCCIKGFGAGAGNCPIEPFVAALEKKGYDTGVNLYHAMDVGDQYLKPLMPRTMELESDQIMLGKAGVYSSFLLFARRAAEQFNVDARDIIKEIGRRSCTEGQEQICIEVAYELAQKAKTVERQ